MTREQRGRARKKARRQLARLHQERYQELYQQALRTGVVRGTASERAAAALAVEFRAEYERIHRAAVDEEVRAAQKLAEELTASISISEITDDFKDDPNRGCSPKHGRSGLFVSDVRTERQKAKLICLSCPVRQACEDFSTANDEQFHVWGGVDRNSAPERKKAQARFAVRTGGLVPAGQQRPSDERRDLEQRIRELWEQNLDDMSIALRLGRHAGVVNKIRKRIGLPTKFGPGGRPKKVVTA